MQEKIEFSFLYTTAVFVESRCQSLNEFYPGKLPQPFFRNASDPIVGPCYLTDLRWKKWTPNRTPNGMSEMYFSDFLASLSG